MRNVEAIGVVVVGLVSVLLFSGCAGTRPQLTTQPPVDCRGYDFYKQLPGLEKKKPFSYTAHYDGMRKRLHNKDGLFYRIKYEPGDPRNKARSYNDDLRHSTTEQAYLAAYQARERAFDAKYAGAIKAKLKVASELFQSQWTKEDVLAYPVYLEKERLPAGIASPASYFNQGMFSYYLEDQWLYEYVKTTGGGDLRSSGLDGYVVGDILEQVEFRLKALYIEYVLTWYHLKAYATPAARSEVARDLAAYYSDVAFRGAAEAMHEYAYWLSAAERCLIADFVARQVASQVLLMDDLERLERFKMRYRNVLTGLCFSQLAAARIKPFRHEVGKERYQQMRQELWDQMVPGEERCIND